MRKFYNTVKNMGQGFQPKTDTCKNRYGKIIEGKTGLVDRWAEYFGELLGKRFDERIHVDYTLTPI